jgi:hypothetical protein
MFDKSPIINTTFTCIEKPRFIIHQQFTAGPVEKSSSVFIPPTLESGFGPVGYYSLMCTEFTRDVFYIKLALNVLFVSSNGTQM